MSGYRLWSLRRCAAASIRAWSSDVRMRPPVKETAMTRALGVMASARVAILTSWTLHRAPGAQSSRDEEGTRLRCREATRISIRTRFQCPSMRSELPPSAVEGAERSGGRITVQKEYSVADFSLEPRRRIAREAARQVARAAVALGDVVAGRQDGRLVCFRPGACQRFTQRADHGPQASGLACQRRANLPDLYDH